MNPNKPDARYALNLVLDHDQRLLLLRRTQNTSLGAGQWGLPAGKIETGESAEQAAIREMREEIGPDHKVSLVRHVGPIRDTFYGGKFEIHLFQQQWLEGAVSLNHEHTAYAWVDKSEISDYDVMLGIEEDIAILGFWPLQCLNQSRLPQRYKQTTGD